MGFIGKEIFVGIGLLDAINIFNQRLTYAKASANKGWH